MLVGGEQITGPWKRDTLCVVPNSTQLRQLQLVTTTQSEAVLISSSVRNIFRKDFVEILSILNMYKYGTAKVEAYFDGNLLVCQSNVPTFVQVVKKT